MALADVATGYPLAQADGLLGVLRCDFVVDFREIEDILDAILSIVGVEWSFTEEINFSLRPHLMKTIFVFVYTMAGLISLQDFIETDSLDIITFLDHILSLD